ncbi:MAG: zinc-ribbon domain-containing protein [Betaproteobacteria bacterium]
MRGLNMPFCKNCGNETEPGAEYCRKCGQRVGEGSVGDEIGREIGDSIRKSIIVESIPEVQLIDAIFGGLVVVLIGGALYLAASGTVSWVGWSNFWAYFLLGLGVLLLIKGIAMFLIRPARNKAYGDIQGGLILGLIGGTFVMLLSGGDWATNWPIFLVIAGGVIVFVAIATYLARIIIK